MTADRVIGAVAEAAAAWTDPDHPERDRAVERTLGEHNRFTEEAVAFAVNQGMAQVTQSSLERWLDGRRAASPLTVGVLEPGNVPLAGLQDYLAVLLAGAHSYLGERYIMVRLLRRDDLPKLFGGVDFTKRTLRFAWHLTSIAWVGLAWLALLIICGFCLLVLVRRLKAFEVVK